MADQTIQTSWTLKTGRNVLVPAIATVGYLYAAVDNPIVRIFSIICMLLTQCLGVARLEQRCNRHQHASSQPSSKAIPWW